MVTSLGAAADCIVRFHSMARLMELERAIFSLAGQTYRPLTITLVTQRFRDDEIAQVTNRISRLLDFPGAPHLKILKWREATPEDGRTHLMNMGIAAASGKYLGFLDYDDVLYPEAYSLLTKRLVSTGAAIAFARVRCIEADVTPYFIYQRKRISGLFERGRSLRDLFVQNFCPIHSFLIDREALLKAHITFNPQFTIEEDYEFLLRFCAACKSDFSMLGIEIGDYIFKTDGSNTVGMTGEKPRDFLAEYEKTRRKMEQVRRATFLSPEVQRSLGLKTVRERLTIATYLRDPA